MPNQRAGLVYLRQITAKISTAKHERDVVILELVRRGLEQHDIGEAAGISQARVSQIVRAAKVSA